jgi:hypothetical protein
MNPDFEKNHCYGKVTNDNILNKIREDNRKLMAEVDEYKATETAKRVTTSYERAMDEIYKVCEPKSNVKDIGSLYTYMLESKNSDLVQLGKRLLLDSCFLKSEG